MLLRSFGLALLCCAVSATLLAATRDRLPVGKPSPFARERQIRTTLKHDSEFGAIIRTASRGNCSTTLEPQALATPDPLLDWRAPNWVIKVSFIVGTDGLVHSPLILEGSNDPEDHIVLDAMKAWRYRPAMCNGVPTEAEGKIAFWSR
jgi:Gram-negative bacterial TonB protein C-terminal